MMHRFRLVDAIVLMGEAQYSKFGHHSRADIFSKQGPAKLSVPLKNRDFRPLNQIELDQPMRWLKKFEGTLKANYGKCPGYKDHGEELLERLQLIAREAPILSVFAGATMDWANKLCGIEAVVVDAWALLGDRQPEWDASEWVAKMVEAVGGTDYLGGGAAMTNYIRRPAFKEKGIELHIQNYKMPDSYETVAGTLNLNGMTSILDPLMTIGAKKTRELLTPTWGESTEEVTPETVYEWGPLTHEP
jgi:hypothetical protein